MKIDNLISLLLAKGAAAFLDASMELSIEECKDRLLMQQSQCEDIITDPELAEHEKGPYRVQLKNIKMALNKIK
jgi:hypothetical protein